MILAHFLDHPAGIAHRDGVGRNVSCHYRTGTNRAVVAYRHTRQHRHVAPYPHVVAYRDGLGPLPTGVAFNGVGGMTGGVKAHVGTDEDVVAYRDIGLVEHRKVEIGKETVAHPYIDTIVAEERLIEKRLSFIKTQ